MPQSPTMNTIPLGAGFFRRIAACFYDFLILISVEMLAVCLALGLTWIAIQFGLSIDGYIDMGDFLTRHPQVGPAFSFYIFAVAALFYTYFWVTAGQTIGMRAWKLEIVNELGGRITWTQGLIRFSTACFGLGNLFVFFSKDNRAFQDLFAQSQIIHIK